MEPLAQILADTPSKFAKQASDIIPTGGSFKENTYNHAMTRAAGLLIFVSGFWLSCQLGTAANGTGRIVLGSSRFDLWCDKGEIVLLGRCWICRTFCFGPHDVSGDFCLQ